MSYTLFISSNFLEKDGVFFMCKKKLKFEVVNETKKMQEAYDEFMLSCKARNLVNETIINYSKSIRYFMDYVGPDFNIYDISKADVNNYISEMLEKVQSNTIRCYCKLIKVVRHLLSQIMLEP